MAKPPNGVFQSSEKGGVVYDYTHDGGEEQRSVQPEYVELTAPYVVMLEATVFNAGDDVGRVVAKAWAGAGGAHSWWTAAGGRFLRYPLKHGQRLVISLDGVGSVTIHWYE